MDIKLPIQIENRIVLILIETSLWKISDNFGEVFIGFTDESFTVFCVLYEDSQKDRESIRKMDQEISILLSKYDINDISYDIHIVVNEKIDESEYKTFRQTFKRQVDFSDPEQY